MFNEFAIIKDPRVLKKVRDYSVLFGLSIQDTIPEITIGDEIHPDFPIAFKPKHKKALRFIRENCGRALLLDKTYLPGRTIALAHVHTEQLLPLVICSRKTHFSEWEYIVKRVFPGCSVFTSRLPDDFYRNEDIMITDTSSLFYRKLATRIKPQQVIIEDICADNHVPLRQFEIIRGMSYEHYRVLFLLNIKTLDKAQKYKQADNIIHHITNHYLGTLAEIVDKFISPKLKYNCTIGENEIIYNYLKTNNYQNIDTVKFMTLLGVYFDLLKGQED